MRAAQSASHSSTLRRRGSRGENARQLLEECEKAIIYVIITAVTIVANGGIALATYARAKFLVDNLGEVSLPDSWLPVLATLQLAGAAGLLLGLLGIPIIGIAAAIGLVLFFTGAVITHLRAGAFRQLPSPVIFLALAAATLVVTANR
jgi:hypothetical protein